MIKLRRDKLRYGRKPHKTNKCRKLCAISFIVGTTTSTNLNVFTFKNFTKSEKYGNSEGLVKYMLTL